jgi:hypothetical protein
VVGVEFVGVKVEDMGVKSKKSWAPAIGSLEPGEFLWITRPVCSERLGKERESISGWPASQVNNCVCSSGDIAVLRNVRFFRRKPSRLSQKIVESKDGTVRVVRWCILRRAMLNVEDESGSEERKAKLGCV